jgi:hypothetical protein
VKRHSEREEAIRLARTTLIDTLRLVDQGMLDESLLGCSMAITFLSRVTNEERVQTLVMQALQRAVVRAQKGAT